MNRFVFCLNNLRLIRPVQQARAIASLAVESSRYFFFVFSSISMLPPGESLYVRSVPLSSNMFSREKDTCVPYLLNALLNFISFPPQAISRKRKKSKHFILQTICEKREVLLQLLCESEAKF